MRWSSAVTAASLCLAADVAAAQITRTNYRDFLPPRPPAVAETRASVALGLFGRTDDRGYADADGDGVDDARAAHLQRVGERFSPLLRRNNFSVPRDPWAVLARAPALIVDRWAGGRLAHSDSISLAGEIAQQATPAGGGDAAPNGASTAAAASLRTLVSRFGPRSARPNFVAAERDTETILFFDLPGHGPKSWRVYYERIDPPRAPRVVLHPFVLERHAASDPARYQLVLQYWFFYPFNDALNTHEGDWEHINVRVTTRAAAALASSPVAEAALLDSASLVRVLEASFPVEDSLTIAAVDYYFHESVVTLDYLALLGGVARGTHGRPRRVWEDASFVTDVLRERTSMAGGKLASHPVVHVGGNNKGPDELLAFVPRFGGSYKRDSHGSYPFSGTWETIGPLRATEKLYGDVVPRVRADSALSWSELIDDRYFVHFRATDLLLVPDWERLEALVATRDDAARRWAAFLLPVYWGFPASESLGSGRLRHFDVGNVALLSPPFHSTWNRVGPSARHRPYEVRVLRTPVSPTSPWSGLQSGWGILNVPLAAWGLMPGYNVALMQVMPWLGGAMNVLDAPPARTYTSSRLPRRFTTAGPGVFFDLGGRDFANALPREGLLPALGAGEQRLRRRAHGGTAATFNLFFTDHLSLENSFAVGWSDVAYDVASPDGVRSVEGELLTRQLTGGLRVAVASARDDAVQLYSRAGYGWLSYRVGNVRADGTPLAGDPVRGGYLPPVLPARHWWPNGWYVGGGMEAFAPERYWLLGLLGWGARVEFTEHFDALHFSEASGRGKAVARRGVLAASLVFGW